MSEKYFSDQLRKAILKSGMTRYRISMVTGIKLNQMSRFLKGKSGLSLKNVDKLLCCIGGKLTSAPPQPQPPEAPKKAASPKKAAPAAKLAKAKKKTPASRAAVKAKK